MATPGDAIPSIYPIVEENGQLFYVNNETGEKYPLKEAKENYSIAEFLDNPVGTESGFTFDFSGLPNIAGGKLYVGLIVYGDGQYPQPVYPNAVAEIDENGVAEFDIRKFFSDDANNPSRDFDLTGWELSGESTIGYRVLNAAGIPLYEGKLGFFGSADSEVFEVNNGTISAGPFIHYAADGTFDDSARVSFVTLTETTAVVKVFDAEGNLVGEFASDGATMNHEIEITGLTPNTEYQYSVTATSTLDGDTYAANLLGEDGELEDYLYSFKTAPEPGSDTPFTFAFTSDGRTGSSGIGGGERFFAESINGYMLKKIAALASFEGADLLQFTGDLISGYDTGVETHRAELLTWKRIVEPWASGIPYMVGIGNHDAALSDAFDDGSQFGIEVDKFPFDTQSGEAIFAEAFVHPENGPISEDGTSYDLNPDTLDFPSYSENAYYYTYGNLAVVNVNSEYWYNPNLSAALEANPDQGAIVGGLHGYIMDAQLEWLSDTLDRLDADPNIDHVFVTQHTPIFPNSGHIKDDMWYNGNNFYRSVVQGENGENLIETGIIERRDQYLLELMESEKVKIVLAGDEHNFNITTITKDTEIYPEDWEGPDIRENPNFRTLVEMTNGAAGAPYYDQGEVPWTPSVSNFTTQNALSLFEIEGDEITISVINPDTLDYILKPGEFTLPATEPTEPTELEEITVGDFSITFDPNRLDVDNSGLVVADTVDLDIPMFEISQPGELTIDSNGLLLNEADLLLAPELAGALGIEDATGADVGDVRLHADFSLENLSLNIGTGITSVSLDFALLEEVAGLILAETSGTVDPASGFDVGFAISDTTDFSVGLGGVAGSIEHTGQVTFEVA